MLFSLFFLNTKKPLKPSFKGFLQWSIIPYQEPPGNYNSNFTSSSMSFIIPYQEPPGNYNVDRLVVGESAIIPYQEPPGNYNYVSEGETVWDNYTIPRTTGELQLEFLCCDIANNYTIPRTTGELQLLQ